MGLDDGVGGKMSGASCTCCREGGKEGKGTGSKKGKWVGWEGEWGCECFVGKDWEWMGVGREKNLILMIRAGERLAYE